MVDISRPTEPSNSDLMKEIRKGNEQSERMRQLVSQLRQAQNRVDEIFGGERGADPFGIRGQVSGILSSVNPINIINSIVSQSPLLMFAKDSLVNLNEKRKELSDAFANLKDVEQQIKAEREGIRDEKNAIEREKESVELEKDHLRRKIADKKDSAVLVEDAPLLRAVKEQGSFIVDSLSPLLFTPKEKGEQQKNIEKQSASLEKGVKVQEQQVDFIKQNLLLLERERQERKLERQARAAAQVRDEAGRFAKERREVSKPSFLALFGAGLPAILSTVGEGLVALFTGKLLFNAVSSVFRAVLSGSILKIGSFLSSSAFVLGIAAVIRGLLRRFIVVDIFFSMFTGITEAWKEYMRTGDVQRSFMVGAKSFVNTLVEFPKQLFKWSVELTKNALVSSGIAKAATTFVDNVAEVYNMMLGDVKLVAQSVKNAFSDFSVSEVAESIKESLLNFMESIFISIMRTLSGFEIRIPVLNRVIRPFENFSEQTQQFGGTPERFDIEPLVGGDIDRALRLNTIMNENETIRERMSAPMNSGEMTGNVTNRIITNITSSNALVNLSSNVRNNDSTIKRVQDKQTFFGQ